MTLPDNIIVDIVFIAVYVILAAATIFNVVKHGQKRRFGYILLLIFNLVRLVGNSLLVAAYKSNYSDKNIIVAGFILQGLGYSFLLSAMFSFLSSATSQNIPGGEGFVRRHFNFWRFLGIINIVALILLIIGYNNSYQIWADVANNTSDRSDAKLDVLANVGDVIFLVLTVIATAGTAYHLLARIRDRTRSQRIILAFTLLVSPFMLVRIVYVTYLTFQTNPFQQSLVLRAVLEYTMEAVVNIIYFIMGIAIGAKAFDDELVEKYTTSYNVAPAVQSTRY